MNMNYIIKEDHTLIITEILNPEASIVIPSELDGYQVTEIGKDFIAMGYKSIPREIFLPETLVRIGSHSFNDMRYLTRLVLPQGLREISDFGIFTCPDLTELYIPASVTDLGQCAFGYMYEHARAYKLNYFTLLCEVGSAAERFAVNYGIAYKMI